MLDFNQIPRFKNSQFEIVTLVPEWARAYEVEEAAIERQIYIAHAWINSNKRRAPKRSYTRFLMNWMRKAMEYGNLKVPQVAVPRPPDPEGDMTIEELIEIRKKNFGSLRKEL